VTTKTLVSTPARGLTGVYIRRIYIYIYIYIRRSLEDDCSSNASSHCLTAIPEGKATRSPSLRSSQAPLRRRGLGQYQRGASFLTVTPPAFDKGGTFRVLDRDGYFL